MEYKFWNFILFQIIIAFSAGRSNLKHIITEFHHIFVQFLRSK